MLLFSFWFNVFCVLLLIFNFVYIIMFNKKNNECLFYYRRKKDIKWFNICGNEIGKFVILLIKCLR